MMPFEGRTTLIIITGLALIISACANSPSQTHQPTAASETTQPAIEETTSINVARENAIADTDQLVLLDEALTPDDNLDNDLPLTDYNLAETQESNTEDTKPSNKNKSVVEKTLTTEANLWTRIRSGLTLPDKEHIKVKSDINWYASHQTYLDRTFKRGRPYLHYIVEQIEQRGIPMEIALLPVVESAFQPFAYSHGRASGIWQFIPATGRRYGLDINWWYDGRRDIKASTNAALDYLQYLNKRFDGDWLLALAAYNSGEGTVSKAIRKNKKRGLGTTFWDLKLPKETRGYVPKLLAISDVIARPDFYKVTLNKIPDQPLFEEIDIGSQLDLAIAADMADLSLQQLYIYNPAFNRWATTPDGPHRLLLPIEKTDIFKEKLAALPEENRVKWVRHRIKNGETLGHIADKYKTTVGIIKKTNEVRGHMIRAGKYLLIPVASKSATDYALSAEQRLYSKQNKIHQNSGKKITYKVRPGDTLWDISRAYKTSHRKLASWNGMAPTDVLRPGQKLVIWSKPTSTTTARLDSSSRAMQKINYRVRNGDSLARISQKFNVSVRQLKNWNPKSTKGKYIQPGQRLVLYVDVTQLAETG